MRKWIVVIVVIIFLVAGVSGCMKSTKKKSSSTYKKTDSDTEVSIACWNLQIFGPTKADNKDLVDYYGAHMNDYDIVIVQEVRDSSGGAIEKLASQMSGYGYVVSKRAGTTNATMEQYVVFYDKKKADYVSQHDYTTEQQANMSRPPLKVTFIVNEWKFDVVTVHTDPDNVTFDLYYTEMMIEKSANGSMNDTIVIGDLNADGRYFNENSNTVFRDWNWVIPNSVDTTVGSGNFTYDRVIVNNQCKDNFVSYGVMRQVGTAQSDHYLIYAIFDTTI